MITLTSIDYFIILAVFVVVALRIIADIREVKQARTVMKGADDATKRSFVPKLTVIVEFESMKNIQNMIQQLQGQKYAVSTVVAIDSSLHPNAAAALRYFMRKHSLRRARVVVRKTLDMHEIATTGVRNGLVVTLPETATLHNTLYREALLQFGDETVGAVRLLPSVRPGRTITGALETLMTAWREYYRMVGGRTYRLASPLPEGIVFRVKHLRKVPKKSLITLTTHRSVYSVAPQNSVSRVWQKLRTTNMIVEHSTVLIVVAILLLLLTTPGNFMLSLKVFAVLASVLMWWALELTRAPVLERAPVALLWPLFFVTIGCFVVLRIASKVFARVLRPMSHTLQYIK